MIAMLLKRGGFTFSVRRSPALNRAARSVQ
jgi:hypothetical protein